LLRDSHDTLDLELLPGDVTVSATDLVIGQVLTVTALVRNRGTAPVTGIPLILARSTNSGLAELARATVSLAPGVAAPVTLAWTTALVGDPVPLAVRVDPFDLIAEVSESNNLVPVSVRVRPSSLPNLAISGADVSLEPDPPKEGMAATVAALVRNPGSIATGPFVVRFFRGDPDAGGSLIGESTIPPLAAFGEATVAVTWSPVDARGVQGISVVADALGQVEEYDETDNRAFRPIGVLGLPDLVLTTGDVVLEPRYPRAGEP